MPKIDLDAIQPNNTRVTRRRSTAKCRAAGSAGSGRRGLTDFGVSQVTLKPGACSSQRHWHDGEDEFLVMLSGEAVLVEDDGETVLRAGDCAAWPKGSTNGHHLRNESDADCTFVVVGGGTSSGGGYSDIDMLFTPDGTYVHKDGSPY